MPTGNELLQLAKNHLGEKYVLGTVVPKDALSYNGPWDCAEFASYLVYQLTGKLYGCANNLGDPSGADAYSGFWARDAEKLGQKIFFQEARSIPGAIVIRIAGKSLIGHVTISDGLGGTVEAHSTKAGVIESTLNNRRWDYGVLVPGIDYRILPKSQPPHKNPLVIYRWKYPIMFGDKVKEIQIALGFKGKKADGIFGPDTHNAIRAFQLSRDLVADGEVGSRTATALGISI